MIYIVQYNNNTNNTSLTQSAISECVCVCVGCCPFGRFNSKLHLQEVLVVVSLSFDSSLC